MTLGVDDVHVWRFDATHGTLRDAMRTILAKYASVAPSELRFETGPFGKPSLAPSDGLEFNLAHSGDVGLLAVSRGRAVGVDVARWDSSVDVLGIANRDLSPTERSAILGAESTLEAFYSVWTRKEAYLKATGVGLARGLDHFDVSCAPDAAQLVVDRRDPGAAARWMMADLAVGDGYSAALVAAKPVGEIALFDAAAALSAATFHAPHASA